MAERLFEVMRQVRHRVAEQDEKLQPYGFVDLVSRVHEDIVELVWWAKKSQNTTQLYGNTKTGDNVLKM